MREVIRAVKTFPARRINEKIERSGPVWQRNYHERVVRNERELDAIRSYIAFNAAKWEFDRENPERCREPRMA